MTKILLAASHDCHLQSFLNRNRWEKRWDVTGGMVEQESSDYERGQLVSPFRLSMLIVLAALMCL
jgi:hypothetical protein